MGEKLVSEITSCEFVFGNEAYGIWLDWEGVDQESGIISTRATRDRIVCINTLTFFLLLTHK